MLNNEIHTWEMIRIILKSDRQYENPYTDVECWIDLQGPDFKKRIYGFWNGGNIFMVRFTATKPGSWKWTSGSNQPDDKGLNSRGGEFDAYAWGRTKNCLIPTAAGLFVQQQWPCTGICRWNSVLFNR